MIGARLGVADIHRSKYCRSCNRLHRQKYDENVGSLFLRLHVVQEKFFFRPVKKGVQRVIEIRRAAFSRICRSRRGADRTGPASPSLGRRRRPLPLRQIGQRSARTSEPDTERIVIDTASSSSAIIEVINPGFWSPSDSSSLICLLISSSLAGRLAGRLAGSVMSRSASCTDAHRGLPACGQRELSARLSRRCLLESSG